MSGGQDWAAELIDTSGGDMSNEKERKAVERALEIVNAVEWSGDWRARPLKLSG